MIPDVIKNNQPSYLTDVSTIFRVPNAYTGQLGTALYLGKLSSEIISLGRSLEYHFPSGTSQGLQDIPEVIQSFYRQYESYSSFHPTVPFYGDLESSTDSYFVPDFLDQIINEIFSSTQEEEFEYGQESTFSRLLQELIQIHGAHAVGAIYGHILNGALQAEQIVETLHALGRSQHQASRPQRLSVLLSNLQSPLPEIRCGAALAIARMDDIQAIPTLKTVLVLETSPYAKACIKRVLTQLEDTRQHG